MLQCVTCGKPLQESGFVLLRLEQLSTRAQHEEQGGWIYYGADGKEVYAQQSREFCKFFCSSSCVQLSQ